MFKNIGAKIKGLAKFFFWVICIIAIIMGLVVMIGGAGNVNSEPAERVLAVVAGVGIIIGGIIVGWLETFFLYGYGELIDSNQKILKLLEEKQTKK